MKFSAADYNILSYLLSPNVMTYEEVIAWAYSQYTDEGIDPFIEKISLALDVADIRELISNTFQVYGEPSAEFLLGETAVMYFEKKLTLQAAINRVLFELDIELHPEDSQELYIAEDYYYWHENPDSQAIKHVLPVFNKYKPIYENAVAKFSA